MIWDGTSLIFEAKVWVFPWEKLPLGQLECVNALPMEMGDLILLATDFLERISQSFFANHCLCELEVSQGWWWQMDQVQGNPNISKPLPRPFETPTLLRCRGCPEKKSLQPFLLPKGPDAQKVSFGFPRRPGRAPSAGAEGHAEGRSAGVSAPYRGRLRFSQCL